MEDFLSNDTLKVLKKLNQLNKAYIAQEEEESKGKKKKTIKARPPELCVFCQNCGWVDEIHLLSFAIENWRENI